MEVEADVGTEQLPDTAETPLFNILDVILLLAIIGVLSWWYLKKKEKDDISTIGKSYSIQ